MPVDPEKLYPNTKFGPPGGKYGARPDGTAKGTGFFGELQVPGGVATEYSMASNALQVNGKPIDFPTIVPTLTASELQMMLNDIIPNKKPIPEPIVQKAIKHAKSRLDRGLSPFAGADEQFPLPK
jgi:hypothetical protein